MLFLAIYHVFQLDYETQVREHSTFVYLVFVVTSFWIAILRFHLQLKGGALGLGYQFELVTIE